MTGMLAAAWAPHGLGGASAREIEVPDLPSEPAPVEPALEAAPPSARSLIPFQLRAGTVVAASGSRELDLPPPGSASPDWSARLDLRLFGQTALSERFSLLANLRLRTELAEGEAYRPMGGTNLDVQELALSFAPTPDLELEAGRINVRGGVATGFNPTDWFKDDSLVVVDSFDTADRREDRLGTVVAQGIWATERAVLLAGVRPEVPGATRQAWLSDQDVIGLSLDRTNRQSAAYARLTPSTGTNLSTTLSTILEPQEPGLGLEVSGTPNEALLLFGEWFAQRRFNFVDESRRDAPLPDEVADELGGGHGREIRHQLALGATWSLPFGWVGGEDVALTGEYHFNEAGLSENELDAWFEAGRAGSAGLGPLWAVRGIALRRQEPLTRHQLFFRFTWNDAADPWPGRVDDLGLSAIAFVSPNDGSALVEASTEAVIATDGRLELSAFATLGGDGSAFGSQAGDVGARLSLSFSF